MTTPTVAVIPVRGGVIPLGTLETIAEAGGRCWLVGSGCTDAAEELDGQAEHVVAVELGVFAPHRWAPALAAALGNDEHLLLPHSPDGRDLAPRLAATLGRPLVSAAVSMQSESAVVARSGGRTMASLALSGPVVATFQLGARTPSHASVVDTTTIDVITLSLPADQEQGGVELIEEIPADPATIDLAEAQRIVAAGVGIGSESIVTEVNAVADLLQASVGATRALTDWGWLPTDRQIGTTGVTVDPALYVAVGISGAVQHTAGLGDPDHVIVVNTDSSCPMMELADLALVCDGPAFLIALRALLDP